MFVAFALLLGGFLLPQAAAVHPQTATVGSQTSDKPTIDPEIAAKFLAVKRIYVEKFGDDKESQQLQAMVIDSLVATKRFVITENKDKADAIIKGVGLEKTSEELHAIADATSVGGAAGRFDDTGGSFSAGHAGIADSQTSTNTVDDARLAVRLTAADGDVLWSTTQESKGAKYKGASADVADLVVKQLIRDLDKLRSSSPAK